jgi:hypothetical protein
MDVEDLKRLFGRTDSGPKPDDAPRRPTNATSIFGQQTTGLGREEWPATAAPTNFFGKPYKPAGPEPPPAQSPDLSAAFTRANKADWISTGKMADLSTLRATAETVSPFPIATPVPAMNFRQQVEEQQQQVEEEQEPVEEEQEPAEEESQPVEEESQQDYEEQQPAYDEDEEEHHDGEHHPLRIVFIVFAAVLLLCAAGFAIWHFGFSDANEPMTKMSTACSQGDGKACYDLATWYEQTITVSNGDQRSAAFYSQACELGVPLACRKLGLKYLLGTGIARNTPKAIAQFEKGCDKADAESCDNLGNIYNEGKGVPVNATKAAEFFSKACLAGDDFGCKWATKLARPVPPSKPLSKAAPKHIAPASK